MGQGWGNQPFQSDPGQLEEAVYKAFQAGASGVVASSEYEEITLDSLEVYGKALRAII
jgi:hypothetical protein